MDNEIRESNLSCKYCDSELICSEPAPDVTYSSGSLGVTRTHLCQKCGAALTNHNSPESGDCLLEVPREFKFALQRFVKRLALLFDTDDVAIIEDYEESSPYSKMELWLTCSLSASEEEFNARRDHAAHGDSISLSLCTCTYMQIHFDGHISYLRWEERETPWDSERPVWSTDRAESFAGLRHRLDELLFETSQLSEVQNLIAQHSAFHGLTPYFCSGGEGVSRLTHWGVMGVADYPERYFLDTGSADEPEA